MVVITITIAITSMTMIITMKYNEIMIRRLNKTKTKWIILQKVFRLKS